MINSFLYKNKSKEDLELITQVCKDIILQSIPEKQNSDNFCGIFIEGRNREINTVEDIASIWSFKLYSEFNYPIYCFVNNDKNFLYSDLNSLNKHRINIIKIPEINTLQEYSKFCIKELYFKLPSHIDNCITLQPDGMLLKSGYEKWLLDNKFDLIGAHWRHITQLGVQTDYGWQPMIYPKIYGVNGGFSFRKASKMRLISTKFNNYNLSQIDGNLSEDSYFSYLGYGSGICKLPTLKECCQFSVDPLTKDIYNNKNNLPFGFHFFKNISEYPNCNHNE